MSEAGDLAARALAGVKWLEANRFDTLYSVGGAWRALARIHMRIKSYPLSVLHHYELPRAEAISVCELVTRQSRRSLEEIPGLPRRRLDTLPFASAVLLAVLDRTNVSRVVVSAGGVREGLLYRELSREERGIDPLHAGARFFAERLAPEIGMGAAVRALTEKLFLDETPGDRRLRLAACELTDVAAYFHPDLRGRQAFDTALRAPFYGVTHRERVAIALTLFTRHAGVIANEPNEKVVALLSAEERARAIRLGLALRFASALAPKAPHALLDCTLVHKGDSVFFRGPKTVESLMGENSRKRLESLAAEFGATAQETYF